MKINIRRVVKSQIFEFDAKGSHAMGTPNISVSDEDYERWCRIRDEFEKMQDELLRCKYLHTIESGGFPYNLDGLTRQQLCKITNAPYYTIDYLRSLDRLPLLLDTKETGSPTIFHLDSIDVVNSHINRGKNDI